MRTEAFLTIVMFGTAFVFNAAAAHAQQRIAMKSGESIELGIVYWVSNCRSLMTGPPEVEVLEGPAQVTLAIKEGMVVPRRFNCANKVPGGTLVATAKDVTETIEAKLTYRVKYKTKDGERQTSNAYVVSLYP